MTPDPILLPDLPAVEKTVRRLAPLLRTRDVLLLRGDLGVGKTTFARYLLQALGIKDDVPSPTFTLVQIYETPQFAVYHFDLYRLVIETELEEIGWEHALANGVVIVEWPERAAGHIPNDHLHLHFAFDDKNNRTLALIPHGAWQERLKETP